MKRSLLLAIAGVPVAALIAQFAVDDPWWTPDQVAARALERGDAALAAETFRDAGWRATAQYRDGEFRAAADLWSSQGTAEAAFDQGNALVFLGKYEDAVESYERALELRPDWRLAAENRDVAAARIRTEVEVGEATEIGADDIVFTKGENNGGDEVEATGGDQLGEDAMRELWLRNVQTKPADFLRAKFSYQSQLGGDE